MGIASPPLASTRRRVGRTVAFGLLTSLLVLFTDGRGSAPVSAQAPARLFVYIHTDVKSAALEKSLRARLPTFAVTVFGRFKDFEDAFLASRPDAVLASGPLLQLLKLPPALQGQRSGKDFENYVLLSTAGTPPLVPPLGQRTLGVVDLLGRTGTQQFVTNLLKAPDIKLKRVTKQEDLLSLLQFGAADAVLLPASSVKTFTERSRLRLQSRELTDARVSLTGVAVVNANLRALIVKQLQSLDGDTNRAIGVEGWVAR